MEKVMIKMKCLTALKMIFSTIITRLLKVLTIIMSIMAKVIKNRLTSLVINTTKIKAIITTSPNLEMIKVMLIIPNMVLNKHTKRKNLIIKFINIKEMETILKVITSRLGIIRPKVGAKITIMEDIIKTITRQVIETSSIKPTSIKIITMVFLIKVKEAIKDIRIQTIKNKTKM